LYDWLVQHGYRVTPQVSVGAYRIDLVVEGARDSRLAVECDGDQHQGPEKWADDVRRQRVLERAGWRFWRCFASSFVRRREAVLEDLRLALLARGIEPLGARATLPAVHTISTEAQPNWWERDAIGGSAPDAGRQAPIAWQEAAETGGTNEGASGPPLAVAVDAAFGVHRLEAHRKAP
jgi:very-short-patch-repair endonuclease